MAKANEEKDDVTYSSQEYITTPDSHEVSGEADEVLN